MLHKFTRVITIQIPLLLIFFLGGWNLLHQSPHIPTENYTYLLELPPELIISSLDESSSSNPEAWADFIAVRSTVSSIPMAQNIIFQLKNGKTLSNLNLNSIDMKLIKQIKRRKQILINYPYYEPGRFAFPVKGYTWYIDTFGANREGGRRFHEGADLFSPEGTLILSVCEGTVEKAGWNRLGGERVGVRGLDGNYYYYAHLKEINPNITPGKKVQKGEIIGTMGHTGDALTTPDHLHFGIELPNGKWINPYAFLKVWQSNVI